jgi:hypothetical protein
MPKSLTVPVREAFPDGSKTVTFEVLKFSEFVTELESETFKKNLYSDYLGKMAAAAKQAEKIRQEKEQKGEARAARADWKKDIYAD